MCVLDNNLVSGKPTHAQGSWTVHGPSSPLLISRINLPEAGNPQLMELELPWDAWAFLCVCPKHDLTSWAMKILLLFFWLFSLILLATWWIKGCPNRLFVKAIVMPHPLVRPLPPLHWPFKRLYGLLSVEFQTIQEYYHFI